MLKTSFLGYDDKERAVHEGYSPDGLSVFGLVGVKTAVSVQKPAEIKAGFEKWWIIALVSLIASVLVVTSFGIIKRRRKLYRK